MKTNTQQETISIDAAFNELKSHINKNFCTLILSSDDKGAFALIDMYKDNDTLVASIFEAVNDEYSDMDSTILSYEILDYGYAMSLKLKLDYTNEPEDGYNEEFILKLASKY